MTRYVRTKVRRKDNLSAAAASLAVAAGVGLVTFFLTRLFLAREPIVEPPGEEPSDAAAD